MCDRIAVLDQGVIQQIGTPVELFDHPVNRFVAQFVGSVNLYEGSLRRVGEGWVFRSPALGECDLPASFAGTERDHVELAFRPHAVQLDATTGDALQLAGAIEGGEFLGEFMRYEIRVGDAMVIADQPHARGTLRPDHGNDPCAFHLGRRDGARRCHRSRAGRRHRGDLGRRRLRGCGLVVA